MSLMSEVASRVCWKKHQSGPTLVCEHPVFWSWILYATSKLLLAWRRYTGPIGIHSRCYNMTSRECRATITRRALLCPRIPAALERSSTSLQCVFFQAILDMPTTFSVTSSHWVWTTVPGDTLTSLVRTTSQDGWRVSLCVFSTVV